MISLKYFSSAGSASWPVALTTKNLKLRRCLRPLWLSLCWSGLSQCRSLYGSCWMTFLLYFSFLFFFLPFFFSH
uniref:Uncharacterized protein n=1 Tax=Rhizophora mucronata TaxID=61149 RepID=A0A2P2QNB1_RHIMU